MDGREEYEAMNRDLARHETKLDVFVTYRHVCACLLGAALYDFLAQDVTFNIPIFLKCL